MKTPANVPTVAFRPAVIATGGQLALLNVADTGHAAHDRVQRLLLSRQYDDFFLPLNGRAATGQIEQMGGSSN